MMGIWMLVVLLSANLVPLRVEPAPQVRNTLEFLYKHLPVEFSLCAYGEVREGVVWMERVDLPKIYRASEDDVLADPYSCSGENILGMIHSHLPQYECQFSRTDIKNFFDEEYSESYRFDFLYCRGNLIWQEKGHPPKS